MAENVKAFFEQLRAEDPELQREYERQAPRFQALRALIAVRQQLKLSQRDLADRMGVKQPVVAKLESGADNVKLDTLARAALAMGCELEVTFKPRKGFHEPLDRPRRASVSGAAVPGEDAKSARSRKSADRIGSAATRGRA